MAFAPVKFFQEVRAEAARVTWPSRRETLITTGQVLAMSVVTAAFFFGVDVVAGAIVKALFLNTGAR